MTFKFPALFSERAKQYSAALTFYYFMAVFWKLGRTYLRTNCFIRTGKNNIQHNKLRLIKDDLDQAGAAAAWNQTCHSKQQTDRDLVVSTSISLSKGGLRSHGIVSASNVATKNYTVIIYWEIFHLLDFRVLVSFIYFLCRLYETSLLYLIQAKQGN